MAGHGAQTVQLNDGRCVGLARYGSDRGLPILALHGAPAARVMFDVADAPARDIGLTLYCPDRPGYGLTPPDTAPSLSGRTDFFEAVADQLRLERFGILGVSGGGPYAVALAARLKTRVPVLGLVSPVGPVRAFDEAARTAASDRLPDKGRMARGHQLFFLRLPKHRRLVTGQAQLAARAFKAAPKAFAKIFANLLSPEDTRILSRPDVERSVIGMTREALRQGVGGGVADLEIFSKPWAVDFADITAKTLLWQGTRDRIVPAPAAFWLASLIEGCRCHRLDGAGHFWVYDHVAEVLGELAEVMRADSLRPEAPPDRVETANVPSAD